MKKFNNFRASTMLCSLCLIITSLASTWYGSFLFLGEPEFPECLKEE